MRGEISELEEGKGNNSGQHKKVKKKKASLVLKSDRCTDCNEMKEPFFHQRSFHEGFGILKFSFLQSSFLPTLSPCSQPQKISDLDLSRRCWRELTGICFPDSFSTMIGKYFASFADCGFQYLSIFIIKFNLK
jgi:hypothetical protein